MKQRLPVMGPLLAALVAAASIAWGLAMPRAPEASSLRRAVTLPSEDTVALLGGLQLGDALVGWQVTAITGPDPEGTIRVEVARDKVTFALELRPLDRVTEQPPVQTERWAIYYGHVRPPEVKLTRNVIRATTNALANRVRAAE